MNNFSRSLIDRTYHEGDSPDMIRFPDGNELIIKDILHMYLLKILRADKSYAPFRIITLESSFIFDISFKINDKVLTVRTGGKVDRVDRKDGITRIVDYKTGSVAPRINSLDALFEDDRKGELDGWLQTLLYCEAFLSENPDVTVKPSIYKVRELPCENSSDALRIRIEKNQELLLEDYQQVRGDFLDGLKSTIATIFSRDEPFVNDLRYPEMRILSLQRIMPAMIP